VAGVDETASGDGDAAPMQLAQRFDELVSARTAHESPPRLQCAPAAISTVFQSTK
jgi:hypothetical protein